MQFFKIYFVLLVVVYLKSICCRDVARELTKRYNDGKMKCEQDGKTKPAYQCSGIMMRGIREIHTNQLSFAWNFKPGNRQRKSFSMTFLRKDTRFFSFPLGYNSGFIIYPPLKTPKNKNKYKVYCAFPIDGWTDSRAGHGCGKMSGDLTGISVHCDKQGINSLEKWVSHFKKAQVRGQCAFDMTIKRATEDFATVIKASTYLRRNSPAQAYAHNELVVHGWNEDKPKNMPIEAFFYILDTPNGYQKAAMYQDDYYKTSGEKVPIVGIRLPTKLNSDIYIKNKHRKPKK